ncbi:MAG: hypothetical protein JXL80_01190 [Planctomycetes bacterium]|nr:hypothetical protein [Planctomycetota bacterium]
MTRLWRQSLVLGIGVLCVAGVGWGQDEAAPPPEHALTKAGAEEKKFYENIRRMVLRYGPQEVAARAAQDGFGEAVGTRIAPILEAQFWGYCYSGDTAWLDRFVSIVDALMGKLGTDPDGRKGWFSGPDTKAFAARWPTTWPDGYTTAFQGQEARVCAAIVDLALLVKDKPELRSKYGDKVDAWVRTIQDDILPKWQKEGLLVGLSDDRAVFLYPARAMKQGESGWVPFPGLLGEKDNITLPHPDQSDIARLHLKLWQLTGDAEPRRLAARLLRWQKSCLRPQQGDTYTWNFWDPSGDYDFRPVGGMAFSMYINPDPVQHLRDVEAFVEAYHSGVVIDDTDLKRLAATQTQVMLQGDVERPKWVAPDGKKRGMLWAAMAEFDDRIEEAFMAGKDARDMDFGGPLRVLQEKPRWGGWKQRKLHGAEVIRWRNTFADYKKDMDELIKSHPPPDPRKMLQQNK